MILLDMHALRAKAIRFERVCMCVCVLCMNCIIKQIYFEEWLELIAERMTMSSANGKIFLFFKKNFTIDHTPQRLLVKIGGSRRSSNITLSMN